MTTAPSSGGAEVSGAEVSHIGGCLVRLVLRGGNALHLVHGVGKRSSLDLDFATPDDFDDLAEMESRVKCALEDRFDAVGYRAFDVQFSSRGTAELGGYEAEFKVIEREKYRRLQADPAALRRQSAPVAPRQLRRFKIQISRGEYCAAEQELQFDDYAVRVYSLEMIAIEKVRALCQQMGEYPHTKNRRARARDFCDIHAILHERSIDLTTSENQELCGLIFDAKAVPLELISRLEDYREFHREDWPSVEQAVSGGIEGYDYHFDFVLKRLAPLEVLWVV